MRIRWKVLAEVCESSLQVVRAAEDFPIYESKGKDREINNEKKKQNLLFIKTSAENSQFSYLGAKQPSRGASQGDSSAIVVVCRGGFGLAKRTREALITDTSTVDLIAVPTARFTRGNN